jgi:hypothetical protein
MIDDDKCRLYTERGRFKSQEKYIKKYIYVGFMEILFNFKKKYK